MPTDPIVRSYDPKLIIVTFGPIIFSGYAEGTFLTITRSGDVFEKSKGADGSIDRVNKNANDFSVACTIKQTSPVNDLLSAVLTGDILANTGKLPFTVKDLNGTTLFFAGQAWIGKDPDPEFSDALTGREWRIDTGIAELFQGGNIL